MRDDRSDDPYARIADLYEAEHRGWTGDLDLYRALAARTGGLLLDLGCGTGRVAIALAEAGHEVHGVDTSAAMLAIARENLGRRGLAATFSLGDMRRPRSHQAFGLAFCALDGLLHLQSAGDVRDALLAAHGALRPGGLFACDVVNPSPDLLAMRDGVVRHQSTFAGPGNTEISHFVSWDIDPDAQTIDAAHFYDWLSEDGAVRRRTTSFRLRYLDRDELLAALRAAGFDSVEIYGSVHLDPLDSDSDRMVFVATKSFA